MATDRNSSSPSNSVPEKPSNSSPAKWLWLVLLIIIAGVAWQTTRNKPLPQPPGQGNTASPPDNVDPVASKLLPKTLTVFVPNDNAKLDAVTIDNPVSQSNGDPFEDYTQMANAAVKVLEKRAPDLFPAGSFLLPVRREGDLVSVNLSEKWYAMPQWSQGSAAALVAQNAVVNTLAKVGDGQSKPLKVQFLKNGKLATTIGELDVKDPLSPDMDAVAKG